MKQLHRLYDNFNTINKDNKELLNKVFSAHYPSKCATVLLLSKCLNNKKLKCRIMKRVNSVICTMST